MRIPQSDPRYNATVSVFNTHRTAAPGEFLRYKETRRMWLAFHLTEDANEARHFVFDFPEKVLLPRLLKQPAQLHFVTGLKFDINGVSSSRTNSNYVFGLPEGHWPNDKTANSVCSMLYHCMELLMECDVRGGTLFLTSDNCAGQNKNCFMMWFCCWLVTTRRQAKVILRFLVCGHTKNVCDGSFGHVKGLFRRTDVRTSANMMRVIDDSSKTTVGIPSVGMQWRNWKKILEYYFTIPPSFALSQYHEICFDSSGGLGKSWHKSYVQANPTRPLNC